MAYNIGGDENTVTDAADTTNNTANVTTYVEDNFGRQSEMIDPNGNTATYSYDRDGNLASTTDRDGRVIDYTYDNLNRETGEAWYTSTARTTLSETLSYTYDAANNLLTADITDGTNTYDYTMTYDKQNRVVSAAEPFGVSLTFGYDNVGNRTSVADSFGGTESSTYNYDNQLATRTFSGASVSYHIELYYNGDGTLETLKAFGNGSPTPEVAQTDYTYYANGQIDTIVEKDSNGGGSVTNTVNSFSYSYDNADRLTSKTENSATTSYGYDYDGEVTTVNGSTLYSYDATGNSTASGVNVTTGNELQTDGNFDYTYDPEGNLTSKVALSGNTLGITTGDNWTYGYDNKNEMTSAVEKTSGGTPELSVTYRYDAFGNRVEKDVTPYSSGTAGTTVVSRFAYDMWKASGGHLFSGENSDIWAEMNGSSSLTYRFMNGDAIDQVFAQMAYTGSTYTPTWLFTDNQGSVRDVVDSTGHVIDAISYGVFGNITSETNSADRDLYTYTGRELDVETNLQYNRARYYDSSTRRWMTEDPIGFNAGDSNIYRYVNNSPTNHTDPSGEVVPFIVAGAALIAIFNSPQIANAPAPGQKTYGVDDFGNTLSGSIKGTTAMLLPGSNAIQQGVGIGFAYNIASDTAQKIDKGQPFMPTMGSVANSFDNALLTGPAGLTLKSPYLIYPGIAAGTYSASDNFGKGNYAQGMVDLGAGCLLMNSGKNQIQADMSQLGNRSLQLSNKVKQSIKAVQQSYGASQGGSNEFVGPVLPGGPNVANQPITLNPGLGPNGMTTLAQLNQAALSNGPTIQVYTKLSVSPNPGQSLNLSVGSPTLSSNLPNPNAQLWFQGQIPAALVDQLSAAGLASTQTVQMGAATGTALVIQPPGTLWVTPFLTPMP